MTDEEALSKLLAGAVVTRQRVTLAKAFIIKHFERDTERLLDAFQSQVEARLPDPIHFGGPDTDERLSKASDAVAWRLAFGEAIWELIHANLILPVGASTAGEVRLVGWRRSTGNSAAMGQWSLADVFLPVPSSIRRPPSAENAPSEVLVEGDLFLKELDIPDIDPDIERALREAVRCFRHELFLACLAMLGKASEGAWINLGRALAHRLPTDQAKKLVVEFEDPFAGIGKKIQQILKLYERSELRDALEHPSGVRLQDLRTTVVWADCVRESRNSIHFGAEPGMTNSYEKVAALLVGVVPHFRVLFRLRRVAEGRDAR